MQTSSVKSEPVKYECPCSKFGCVYRYAQIKFDKYDTAAEYSTSVEEFNQQMVSLFQNIWIASYTKKMTLCVVDAVRACIQAIQRIKAPSECLDKFYGLRLQGSSLPASVILHSALEKKFSKTNGTNPRRALVQIILDHVPLTADARDELFLACAKAGCNVFFNQIQARASLSQLQIQAFPMDETTNSDLEIGKTLRSQVGFVESVQVKTTSYGFQLKWAIPDLLQAVRSNIPFRTEFIAKGRIWGAYFGAVGQNEIGFKLRILEPSQSEGTVGANLLITRYKHSILGHIFQPENIMMFSRKDFSKTDVPTWTIRWLLYKGVLDQVANKDGSCYLYFDCGVKRKSPY